MTDCNTHRIAGMLVACILTACTVRAQHGDVHGRIADDDGQSVPGAHVVLLGTERGDAAALDGTYRIDGIPPGRYVLGASAVGFAPDSAVIDIVSGADIRIDFELAATLLESEAVVVTASRRTQAAGAAATSISTLSAREIEARNMTAVDDALRHISGVQLAGNQVSIRGSSGFSYNTGSRVLLLVDGMPMLRPDADGIPFDAVPMHQVERIEVLKGPGSALYGGGALGGIVHVITKMPPNQPESFVEIYGGAYQPVRYEIWRRRWQDADMPRPLGGMTLSHGRRISSRAGIWADLTYRYDAGHLHLGRSRGLQAFTRFTYRPAPDARLDVLAGANRRLSDHFLFWNGARDALNPGRIEIGRSTVGTGSDDNLINQLSIQPSYTDVLGANLLATIRGRLHGVLIQPLDENRRPKPLTEGTVGFRYGGEVQLDYEPAEHRRFIGGATADANATRSSFFDLDDPLSQPEGAVFGQWEEQIGDRLEVKAGLRFDAYRIRAGMVERKLSPRVGTSITLSPSWSARIAYCEGFRVPSVAERFIDNSDYLPVISNLDLKPETSRSYEIGIRGASIEHAGLVFAADAAAFWSDYQRLVEPTFVVSETAFQFVNVTRARIRGIEAVVEASTTSGRTAFSAGYTHLHPQDLSTGRPLVFRSEHLVKATASTIVGRIELGADFRAASEPERVDSDFARFVTDADVTGPKRVLDLRIGATFGGWRAAVHVKNALDYYYVERPALLAPPRHIILQVSAAL